MPRVIITAKVADTAKWEEGFRTHGALFTEQTINSPIHFTTTGDNEVATLFEPEDLGKYMEILESPATAEAMEFDGIDRDSVKVYVLDNEFDPR